MATGWKDSAPKDAAWRAAKGTTPAERAAEQDKAAGGRENRVVAIDASRSSLASICLRLPVKSRRVYAYLRWAVGKKTTEKYICQVDGHTRAANLTRAWTAVRDADLLVSIPATSWATSPEVRNVMRGNRPRDTRPEKALRSAVHALGLRYRVARRPIATLPRTADLVFTGSRVAVFLDGCFWHGCPAHHRPASRNSDFWAAKIQATQIRDRHTDSVLAAAGWTIVRVWEHEPPADAARRVEHAVLARAISTRPGLLAHGPLALPSDSTTS